MVRRAQTGHQAPTRRFPDLRVLPALPAPQEPMVSRDLRVLLDQPVRTVLPDLRVPMGRLEPMEPMEPMVPMVFPVCPALLVWTVPQAWTVRIRPCRVLLVPPERMARLAPMERTARFRDLLARPVLTEPMVLTEHRGLTEPMVLTEHRGLTEHRERMAVRARPVPQAAATSITSY